MAKLVRTMLGLGLVGIVAGGMGFLAFASTVSGLAPAEDPRADAIVVLTGDEDRIATGVRLMVEGRAQRLLISGVHPTTRVPTELKRRIHGADAKRQALVRCCVDIGHEATNTSGNAAEARRWALSNGFHSLIVVTSSYHMLRSRTEFSRVMPDIELVSYPVRTSRNLNLEAWWRHWPTGRLLAGEYIKFLGSSARYALSRLVAANGAPEHRNLPPGSLPSAAVNPGSGQ
ncbi:MAG: YdcF family protein [Hyphomicrobiaceae bacterium]